MNDSIGMERYRLEESKIVAEGTVILRLAGWECHRGQYGAVRWYQPESPDYDFWWWVVTHGDRWPDSFSEADLPGVRQQYEDGVV